MLAITGCHSALMRYNRKMETLGDTLYLILDNSDNQYVAVNCDVMLQQKEGTTTVSEIKTH